MKWATGLVLLMLLATAGARFYIFRLQDKDIAPEFYERKMKLEDFEFSEAGVPKGFRQAAHLPGGGENPAELKVSELGRLEKPAPAFPEPSKIVGARAMAYSNALGDQVVVVACQYGGAGLAPQPPAGFLREGAFLATALSPAPLLRDSFANTLAEQLARLKKDSVKLNKVKTIGNVLLKLFMDILVGTFAFLLALFLTKYFLIMKRVEE